MRRGAVAIRPLRLVRIGFASCVLALVAGLGAGPLTDDQKRVYIDEQLRFADGCWGAGTMLWPWRNISA